MQKYVFAALCGVASAINEYSVYGDEVALYEGTSVTPGLTTSWTYDGDKMVTQWKTHTLPLNDTLNVGDEVIIWWCATIFSPFTSTCNLWNFMG